MASTFLVVNADEFGLSVAISRGILRAHRDGIVTSTSVMGNVPDAESARADLSACPGLGVGAHLTLVRGKPVSPPEAIPSLVDERGQFPDSPRELMSRWARGRLSAAEIDRELDAQVVRLRGAGLTIDHLDTHLHIGFLPVVAEAIEGIARRHGIGCLRSRVEAPNLTWFTDLERGLELGALRGLAWISRRRLGLRQHGPQSWGFAESGNLGRTRILEILGRLGPGIHELLCHPGEEEDTALLPSGRWRTFDRPQELTALTSPTVRDAIKQRGIELCRFSDLF